jgi:hypothetical protein
MEHNIYDAPESELNSDASVGPIKPGLILKILLILFMVMTYILLFDIWHL